MKREGEGAKKRNELKGWDDSQATGGKSRRGKHREKQTKRVKKPTAALKLLPEALGVFVEGSHDCLQVTHAGVQHVHLLQQRRNLGVYFGKG